MVTELGIGSYHNGESLALGQYQSCPYLYITLINPRRHQILIRLTSLGLKESSTRLSKRKRDTEDPEGSTPATETSPPNQPDASPTLHHSSSAPPAKTPWQIPAASTANMPPANNNTSYNLNSYRPRPTESPAPKPPSASYPYGSSGGQ